MEILRTLCIPKAELGALGALILTPVGNYSVINSHDWICLLVDQLTRAGPEKSPVMWCTYTPTWKPHNRPFSWTNMPTQYLWLVICASPRNRAIKSSTLFHRGTSSGSSSSLKMELNLISHESERHLYLVCAKRRRWEKSDSNIFLFVLLFPPIKGFSYFILFFLFSTFRETADWVIRCRKNSVTLSKKLVILRTSKGPTAVSFCYVTWG